MINHLWSESLPWLQRRPAGWPCSRACRPPSSPCSQPWPDCTHSTHHAGVQIMKNKKIKYLFFKLLVFGSIKRIYTHAMVAWHMPRWQDTNNTRTKNIYPCHGSVTQMRREQMNKWYEASAATVPPHLWAGPSGFLDVLEFPNSVPKLCTTDYWWLIVISSFC